jgi:hypothetical protein
MGRRLFQGSIHPTSFNGCAEHRDAAKAASLSAAVAEEQGLEFRCRQEQECVVAELSAFPDWSARKSPQPRPIGLIQFTMKV